MLTFYGAATKGPIQVDREAGRIPDGVHWIDAFDPSADEIAFLAKLLDVTIPTHADLVEIESSSRLTASNGALLISFPALIRGTDGYPSSTPVGFVITPARVVTLRFARLPSFESLTKEICAKGEVSEGGMGATVTILEIIVDHIADHLERIGEELDSASRDIFHSDTLTGRKRRPRQSSEALHGLLRKVGSTADLISKVSESLLGLSRIPPFVIAKGETMTTPALGKRLETIGTDAKSLHEYQDHLANKTQFLLDALLGLTNIEQNNVFRVLTVVSVIGIPPTFVASMYGMNFKMMPELDWHYGYAWGLFLITLSALVPALWFKVKGWW